MDSGIPKSPVEDDQMLSIIINSFFGHSISQVSHTLGIHVNQARHTAACESPMGHLWMMHLNLLKHCRNFLFVCKLILWFLNVNSECENIVRHCENADCLWTLLVPRALFITFHHIKKLQFSNLNQHLQSLVLRRVSLYG